MPAKQMLTVITFGYESSFVVEAKDVSTILTIMSKAQRVTDRWIDGEEGSVWVKKEGEHIGVRQTEMFPPIAEEEYKRRRDAADERRKAKDAEEAAAVTGERDGMGNRLDGMAD